MQMVVLLVLVLLKSLALTIAIELIVVFALMQQYVDFCFVFSASCAEILFLERLDPLYSLDFLVDFFMSASFGLSFLVCT